MLSLKSLGFPPLQVIETITEIHRLNYNKLCKPRIPEYGHEFKKLGSAHIA
jgi:hypothetical protein